MILTGNEVIKGKIALIIEEEESIDNIPIGFEEAHIDVYTGLTEISEEVILHTEKIFKSKEPAEMFSPWDYNAVLYFGCKNNRDELEKKCKKYATPIITFK